LRELLDQPLRGLLDKPFWGLLNQAERGAAAILTFSPTICRISIPACEKNSILFYHAPGGFVKTRAGLLACGAHLPAGVFGTDDNAQVPGGGMLAASLPASS